MRKILLFTIASLIYSLSFSQTISITSHHGDDISNTTITIDILSSDISSNSEFEAVYECFINNTSSSDINATILREVNNIPAGSESFFCSLGGCLPPNVDTKSGPISASSADDPLTSFHYLPIGNFDDATVVYLYTFDGSTEETRITIEYHVIDDTGIKTQISNNTFVAYPNPANSNVSISYNVTEQSEIVIYNIVGEKVRAYLASPSGNNLKIETSDLPAGTYFYSMISDSKITGTKRLVIKH